MRTLPLDPDPAAQTVRAGQVLLGLMQLAKLGQDALRHRRDPGAGYARYRQIFIWAGASPGDCWCD